MGSLPPSLPPSLRSLSPSPSLNQPSRVILLPLPSPFCLQRNENREEEEEDYSKQIRVTRMSRQLDSELDLSKLMRPFLIKLVAKHYDPLQFIKRSFNSIYELGMYMEEFPRDLKNAMRKINAGEIKVDLRHKGIDPLVHTINRVTKQLVSAVIVAALLIGSTQMIIHNIHPLWGQNSSIGIVGMILAGIIGLSMLKDLRRGDHDDWNGWKDN